MLSNIKGIFKNMHNAFYEWAWPKGVRWYRIDTQIRIPRFPAPGSIPIEQFYQNPDKKLHEYKTAYRDSQYNIRYNGPSETQDFQFFYHDALGTTVEEKLIQLGYISKEDGKVTLKMDEAKQLYLLKTDVFLLIQGLIDQIGINEQPIEKGNRDSIAQFVRQQFQANKESNNDEVMMDDINDIYKQNIFNFTSWGIADTDPVYQQVLLDIEKHIEDYIRQEKEKGQIQFFVGQAQYWNVLDNSHQSENILLTQKVVKDIITELDIQKIQQSKNTNFIHEHEPRQYPYNRNKVHEI